MNSERIGLSSSNFELDFLKENMNDTIQYKGSFKIMIADDDIEVHTITKMILKPFTFDEKNLIFIDTYSGKETMEALEMNPDTAVLFLDVVMEENHSGLKVVDYLRNSLGNHLTRIILRTGQPGEAPEDKIIREYDINDYRLKTDMTVQRLNTSLYSALRGYHDILKLDQSKRGLEKMIEASAEMFKHKSMSEFLNSILNQISNFYQDDLEMFYVRENMKEIPNGFICINNNKEFIIVAAKGKYEKYIGRNIGTIGDMKNIYEWISNDKDEEAKFFALDSGFIVKRGGNIMVKNYIFVEGRKDDYKLDLINLFLANYSMALDNFFLDKLISETQEEVMYTLGEVIETHFEETSEHLKRITNMMQLFGQQFGFNNSECEFIKIASTLHDVGKIGIPDTILKKPGKLTDEEFSVMKKHSEIGYKILSKTKLEVLQLAAEIALHHHEKYDGTGYPEGIKGKDISIYSRMMAIVDVFDAMTHRRVYKDAFSIEDTMNYIIGQKGRHFDAELVDLFLENINEMSKIAGI